MKKYLSYRIFFLFVIVIFSCCSAVNHAFSKRSYCAPVSYEKAYSYRINAPFESIYTLLNDMELEILRKNNPPAYVNKICDCIKSLATNDFEKVKMVYDFILLSIGYDSLERKNSKFSKQDWSSVIKRKSALAEGFANTFEKFCDELGISSEKVYGLMKEKEIQFTKNNIKISKSVWNIVKINEAWYFVDCYRSAIDYNRIYNVYTSDWLFIKSDYFIYTHYPLKSEYQLISQPISELEYRELAYLPAESFSKFDLLDSKIKFINKVKVRDSYSFSLVPQKDDYIIFPLVFNVADYREVENCYFVKTIGAAKRFDFSFPDVGLYEVAIVFAKLGESSGKEVLNFFVETCAPSYIRYPKFWWVRDAKNLEVISPVELPLKKNICYTFIVYAENQNHIYACGSKIMVPLDSDGKGLFKADILIPDDEEKIELFCAESED